MGSSANPLNSTILQLIAEGPNGIESQQNLQNQQAAQAKAAAAQENAQAALTQQTAQSQAALTKYYQDLYRGQQAAAAPGSANGAPAAGQSPLSSMRNLFKRLSQPKNMGQPVPEPELQPPAQQQAAPPAQVDPSEAQHPLDVLGDPKQVMAGLIRAGVNGPMALQHVQGIIDLNKELGQESAAQLENRQKRYAEAGNQMVGYLDNPGPDSWKATYGQLRKIDPELAGILPDPSQNPAPTENDLAGPMAVTGAHALLVARNKTEAEAASSTAGARKANAEAANQEMTNNIRQRALDAFAADPSKGGQIIDQTLPATTDQAANASYKAALQSAMQTGGPEAAQKIVEAAAAHAAAISMKTNPVIQQAEADQAKKTQAALEPGEVQKANDIARINLPVEQARAQYQNALQQGDKATADYASTLSDARQTVATAQTIQKVVDLARSNSPIAGQQLKAMIPEFTNAIQDIKRMGGAQAGSISSALGSLAGEIKSGVGLTPETDKVLQNIMPYVDTVANGAISRANSQIDATNSAYKKNFAHEPMPVQYGKDAKTGKLIVSRDAGNTWSDAKTGAEVK